jgi:hypothetical protein
MEGGTFVSGSKFYIRRRRLIIAKAGGNNRRRASLKTPDTHQKLELFLQLSRINTCWLTNFPVLTTKSPFNFPALTNIAC